VRARRRRADPAGYLKFLEAEIEAGRLLLAGRQEDGSGGVLVTADMAE
jgi:hypothetical protein